MAFLHAAPDSRRVRLVRPGGWTRLINAGLDRSIAAAHTLRAFGRPLHPYFLVSDASVVLTLVLAAGFSRFVEGFTLSAFAFAFVFMQILYQGLYLATKQQLTGLKPKPCFSDMCFVVIPAWLLSAWLADLPMAAAADFAALSLALVLAMRRLASFFGGSHRGKPSRCGVRYEADQLRRVRGWREFDPRSKGKTGVRVLPLALISSAVCFALFGALSLRVLELGQPDGWALPRLLLSVSMYRFVEEFYREGHDPEAGLNSAQRLSVGLAVASAIALYFS